MIVGRGEQGEYGQQDKSRYRVDLRECPRRYGLYIDDAYDEVFLDVTLYGEQEIRSEEEDKQGHEPAEQRPTLVSIECDTLRARGNVGFRRLGEAGLLQNRHKTDTGMKPFL